MNFTIFFLVQNLFSGVCVGGGGGGVGNSFELRFVYSLQSPYEFHDFLFSSEPVFRGKQFRTISLNAHQIIIFKNQRDELQVKHLRGKSFLTI